ncbi:lymphocyte cytosolic protein 2a [Electrophorus electricus]|uniref:Lymphocyte cytosolic protein 2 n=1 Tax=Electrophorus electricus TaxID=8005 RepID=A0A4W4ETL2_ELEEL|nr:lymphocyte cytosolic protein 2a [Electrophorus electricus]
MSFDSIPSKTEVMSWDPQHLADFLKRRDLTGCDKVIIKYNMNGQRFLNMSENDLQKFPKLHAPLISKICREINKKEEKRSFFPKRTSAPKYQETVEFAHDDHDQGWGSEEFESDDDYESPDSNNNAEGSGGDYESATEGGADSDNDYEPPPSEPSDDAPHHQICAAKPMCNSEYIDRAHTSVKSQPPVPPARPGPGPPLPTSGRPGVLGSYQRTDQSPQRLQKPPPPDRSKKPGTLERRSNNAPVQGVNVSATNDRTAPPPRSQPAGPEKFVEPLRMPKPPLPAVGVRRSASSLTPSHSHNRHAPDPRNEFHDDNARPSSNTFPLHSRNPSPRPPPHGHSGQPDSIHQTGSLPSRLQEAINSHRSSSRTTPQQSVRFPDQDTFGEQDMDPAWYVGQVTRGQAENSLRVVNRDGAFLVRDSSKGSASQPYTLMVLYQNKVFNIQIRKEQNGFLLGTGLKSCEIFPSVSDIIKQHMQMPLLLIDAKNRGRGQQNQCALTHPAGF